MNDAELLMLFHDMATFTGFRTGLKLSVPVALMGW